MKNLILIIIFLCSVQVLAGQEGHGIDDLKATFQDSAVDFMGFHFSDVLAATEPYEYLFTERVFPMVPLMNGEEYRGVVIPR